MGSIRPISPGGEVNRPLNQGGAHSFVYRWLIARGVVSGSYPSPYARIDPAEARDIFFYQHGTSARMAGKVCVPDGSIVGFWNQDGELVHSMIALHSDTWLGAGNHDCFGLERDQKLIDGVSHIRAEEDHPYGWAGDGNEWLVGNEQLKVTFLIPRAREF